MTLRGLRREHPRHHVRSSRGSLVIDVNVAESSLPDAVLRPVRDGNAFESTVEHLATAIRLGAFGPGDRLPAERDLAERLRVSRATLRDAIGALRQAGLVETRRGRTGGTVVVAAGPSAGAALGLDPQRHSRARVDDVLAFRRVVEPGAAGLAASSPVSPDGRERLLAALDAVSEEVDDRARRVADARFHLAVAMLSGSAMLVDAVTQAQSVLSELLGRIPVLRVNIEHSDSQHAAVVDAVLAGDPLTARRVMEEHCDATSALLRALLS